MNAIIHFEIPAENVERAKEFYRAAFGWQIQSTPGVAYSLVTTTAVGDDFRPKEPGAINGGLLERQGPIQAPVLVVGVADMNEAVETVRSFGGSIEKEPFQVGSIGISCYFRDPEGNLLCLWQPLGH